MPAVQFGSLQGSLMLRGWIPESMMRAWHSTPRHCRQPRSRRPQAVMPCTAAPAPAAHPRHRQAVARVPLLTGRPYPSASWPPGA